MRDFADDLATLRKRLEEAKTYLDLSGLQARLRALEADVGRPDLWDDPDAARTTTTAYGRVGGDVELRLSRRTAVGDPHRRGQHGDRDGDVGVGRIDRDDRRPAE